MVQFNVNLTTCAFFSFFLSMLKAPNALKFIIPRKSKIRHYQATSATREKVENEKKKKEEIKKVVYVLSRYVCIHQILFF